jgi:cytochrome c-type biogenesis protein CcmF
MIAEIGNLFLYLLLAQSVFFTSWALAKGKEWLQLREMFWAWSSILFCTLAAMACLIYCFVISDFSVATVYYNSSTHKPFIFKVVGAWGNHEGSMLLWLISLSAISWISTLIYRRGSVNLEKQKLVIGMLTIQFIVLAIFLLYVIFVSNPFVRLFPTPREGLGLNPLLQDIGLAMHPPSLYLGYVGFSLAYSGIIAALLMKKVNRICAEILLPWAMFSWTILTIGIALGAWWAYRELGWGGFWFWDPVENLSLLPWLGATILFHSLLVLKKTGNFKHWVVFSAIGTFVLSILGTFVVRSGIITSVHTFALDPERGNFILAILLGLSIAAILLYAWRRTDLLDGYRINILSREFFVLLNNLLLLVAIAIILIATFYPLFLKYFTGQQVTVGAPYFNITLVPLSLVTLVAAAIGSVCAWQNDKLERLWKSAKSIIFYASVLTLMVCIANFDGFNFWYLPFIAAGFLLLCTMLRMFFLTNVNKAMFLSHVGFGLLVISLALHFMCKIEVNRSVRLDEKIVLGGYEVQAINIVDAPKDNYYARQVAFLIYYKGRKIGMLTPENRLFPLEKQLTRESAVLQGFFADLYMTIGDVHAPKVNDQDQTPIITLHASYNPAIAWIWFSCLLISLGGGVSFIRRLF